jgi:hypothetical protein
LDYFKCSPFSKDNNRKFGIMKINKKYLAVGIVASLAASGGAFAANSVSVPADIAFVTALTVTKTSNMDFGKVASAIAGVYVLTANDAISATSGQIVGGVPAAGVVNIVGDTVSAITISVGSYVASTHVTLSAATCTYAASSDAVCDSGTPLTGQTHPNGGGGTNLKVGATATVSSGTTTNTTEQPSLTVTVTYT